MLAAPLGPLSALAESTTDEGTVTSLTDAERQEFVEYYLDVFGRGTRHLNETPGTYDYSDYLKYQVLKDLVAALKTFDEKTAREFDIAYAAPRLGLATEENPTIHKDTGEPITQEQIDEMQGALLGSLIFEREAFFKRLGEFVEGLQPESQTTENQSTDAEDAKNAIMEELEREPISFWANDLEDAIAPEGFVADIPTTTVTTEFPVESDMTTRVATSPFAAADPDAWLDPEFRLTLPELHRFLAGLTDLPTDDLLHLLGVIGEAGGEAVQKVEGTLEAFPEVHGPVMALRDLTAEVQGSIVTLPDALPIALRLDPSAPVGGELPPEVAAIMSEAESLASHTQYVAEVNGVSVTGAYAVPTPVDVNGDNVPDLVLQLTRQPVLTDAAGGLVRDVPVLSVDRIQATSPEGAPALPNTPSAVPVPEADTLQLTFAYYPTDGDELAAYVVSIKDGADHFEVALTNLDPAVEIKTANAQGAYTFAAIIQKADMTSILTMQSAVAPVAIAADARVIPADGVANLKVTPVVATGPLDTLGGLTVSGIGSGPAGRVAIAATSSNFPDLDVTSTGSKFHIETEEGAAVTIERQDFVGQSLTAFTQRRIALENAPETTDATLDLADVSVRLDGAGSGIETLVGTVSRNAYTSASWAEVTSAGRRLDVELSDAGASFESDRSVGTARAILATSRAAAMQGAVPTGVFLLRDDLMAFSLDGVKTASVLSDGESGYDIDVGTAISQPFTLDVAKGGDSAVFTLTNLPTRTLFDVTPEGLSLGSSASIDGVTGELYRRLDGPTATPTYATVVLDDLTGTAALSMSEATLNLFTTGSLGQGNVLGSNTIVGGNYQFLGIPSADNHVLADVQGTSRRYSAELTDIAGSLFGGLLGPLGDITIELNMPGGLCQSFGANGSVIELCLSNVPSKIKLSLRALPNPTITYNANAVIDWITLRLTSANVNVAFSILKFPKQVQLALSAGALTLSTDTRLGGLTFTASIADTTLAAAILDLPKTVTVTWGTGGVTPAIPAGDAIGRAYLFVSRPGLNFLVDIVHLPYTVISWNAGAINVGPVGDRIGSATVQLAVNDLAFFLQAVGIPGLSATWNAAGGTLSTTAPLDSITVSLRRGLSWNPTLSLFFQLAGVPKLTGSWSTGGYNLALATGKISSLIFRFQASDLRLDLTASGIPTTTVSISNGNFNVNAPGGLDQITAFLGKGVGYVDPATLATDYVGVYLRPDSTQFRVMAKFTGIKQVALTRDAWTNTQTLSLGFTTDKTITAVLDVESSAIKLYLEAVLQNLPATTTLTFKQDGVTMSGTAASWWRPQPYIQAKLYVGTPATYGATPEPRWPYQTAGLATGIMGNTFLDTTNGGLATKWKIYAPLPDVFSITKTTTKEGIPNYGLNTGISLGKLDIRTQVRVNLNTCSWCAANYLDTMAVVAVSNLPATLTVTQSLGSGYNAGNPSISYSAGAPIQKIFLGLRFDNQWYGTANEYGGFPIWASVGDIPTSVSMSLGKTGGWGAENMPFFSYSANANTLDASFYLDIGYLFNRFAKPTILAAKNAGRAVPDWLVGLAQYNAKGHLFLQIVDIPATGISLYRSGDRFVVNPDPWGNTRLTKFYADFELRLERTIGNNGCWICTSWIDLRWYWEFSWYIEIRELKLLLENLNSLTLDLGIETIVNLDGHLVFNFLAGVGARFRAGISLVFHAYDINWTIFCLCISTPWLGVYIDLGTMSFQLITRTWGVNYWTWAYYDHCSWSGCTWVHDHKYVGVRYTYPGNWQFDGPIAVYPWVPFRGLNLYSGEWHVIVNPRVLVCAESGGVFACVQAGWRLIPEYFVIAYAWVKYFSASLDFWNVHHHH